MKPLIYTFVITAAILVLGFTTIKMLENDSEALGDIIAEIEKNVVMDKWEEAGIKERQLKDLWEKYKKKWPMFIDHAEVDNVSLYLSELEVFVDNRDKTLSAAKLAVLKHLLSNIPEKEYVILKNIL